MTYKNPGRAAPRRSLWTIFAAFVVLSAVIFGLMGKQPVIAPPASSSSTVPIPRSPPGEPPRALGMRERGALAGPVSIFDDEVPGVAKLDPRLLGALRRAAVHAADNGIEILITSGWRSSDYQEQLVNGAVSKYGSEQEAARWVATPETSAHVSGDAVDIGPPSAIAWLVEHGAEYGLCQIYRNEPWHFELRPQAIGHSCPARYADPTLDPRMQS